MTRFVIDAPTLLHIVSNALRVDASHGLVAPNAIRSQALQLLLQDVRAGRLDEREALELHDRMTELKIRLLGDRVSRRTAWRLAREHGLDTVLEAEYLALVVLQADALVTVDPGLAETAAGIVPLAPLDDLVAT